MYSKVYILSPTTQATGGTELLQQLAYKLRIIGIAAYMVYTTPFNNSPVQKVFLPRYNNPSVTEIEDSENNLMIVSEAAIYNLLKYKHIQKSIWWLSVDFYGGSFRLPTDLPHRIFYKISDRIYSLFDKKWIHFVQSEYAYQYCLIERNIPANNIFKLSDYLSHAYIDKSIKNINALREDNVLYNPKKGLEFTKSLMDLAPEIKWIPIQNMTSDEIADLMNKSKIYIDFGNHPGKDRIPREAAISGCCIITGTRGAANNDIDIPIPRKYKLSEDNPQRIIEIIKILISNYDKLKYDYNSYREKIISEESTFEEELSIFFQGQTPKNDQSKFKTELYRLIFKPLIYAMKFVPTFFGYK